MKRFVLSALAAAALLLAGSPAAIADPPIGIPPDCSGWYAGDTAWVFCGERAFRPVVICDGLAFFGPWTQAGYQNTAFCPYRVATAWSVDYHD
ncbi:hypothetical protein L3Q67_42035 [Saccharothrix sp. AJ9571]|nr:hypothetical protein L3Q67_42035 [Saccharothrix sp. AJ9571]